jgi:ferric-dicitrate binding protein FerR (iron transport regulator)
VSQQNHADREIRTLRKLVDELRAEPAPELDWERVERNLLARIGIEKQLRPAPGVGGWRSLLTLVAAAAAIVLLATGARHLVTTPPRDPAPAAGNVDLGTLPMAAGEPGEPARYLASAVPVGAAVQSDGEPVRFRLPGVVDWVLSPHSRLRVASMSLPHLLVLERGSVRAEVVERRDSNTLVETFAVEARGTRVAVHGTVLAVSLAGDRVTVAVERGTVSVGPTGLRGASTGRLLLGPARAVFAADRAALLAVLAPEPPAVAVGGPTGGTPLGGEPRDRAPGDRDDSRGGGVAADDHLPGRGLTRPGPNGTWGQGGGRAIADEPPGADTSPTPAATSTPTTDATDQSRLTVAAARALLLGCLTASANAGGGSGVNVTISTTVSLQLDDAGKLRSVRFDPPLRPDLQQRCAAVLFGHGIAAKGRSASFTVVLSSR